MKVRKDKPAETAEPVQIPQMAGPLMCFAVQRGTQLWASIPTDFRGEAKSTISAGSGPVLVSEFRQVLPDFPPVHQAKCPPKFARWAPHWGDIRNLASSFKKYDPGRLIQKKKQDWTLHGDGAIALVEAFPGWIREIDKALQEAMADVGMDVLSVHATCPRRSRAATGLPFASLWDASKADILARVFSKDACMTKYGHGLQDIANTYWAMWLSTELDRFKKRRNRALDNMGKIRAELGTRLHDPKFYNLPADDVADTLGDESISVPQLRALVKKLKDYKVNMRFVAHPEDDDDEDDEEETPYGDEEQDSDDEEMPNADLAAAQERLTRAEAEEAKKSESQRIVEWADLAMGSIVGVMEAKSRRRIVTPKQKRTFTKSARRGRDRGRVTAAKVNLLATDAEITAFARSSATISRNGIEVPVLESCLTSRTFGWGMEH
ncbi:hypothetical protein BDZ89DRAFT_119620 [Hymenopellis radicata]|nr:hypothetical protein BDZ89DRAFT_119620 [Hymenopellis radicata]